MGRAGQPRLDRTDLARSGVSFVVSVLGLALAGLLLPGLGFDGLLPIALVAIVMALAGLVVRPLLAAIATPLGWLGALALALLGQAALAYLALSVVPGVRVDSFWTAFWATWIVAVFTTSATWIMTAGTNDAVFVDLVRRARRADAVADPEVTGILFVQLDGVPFPVLQWGVLAGTMPTLSRWIRSGSHEFAEWTPTLPATTPASQMGILHGTTDGIPAFRWVDRATGRVFVANKPADAADIEALHSDGLGLLVDGGVSVSNLFSGDAPQAFATMSRIGSLKEDRDGRRLFNTYLMRPDGFVRGVVRTVSELARERLQARRQVRQDMRPRVHRGWGFAGERGALNGVLRDFNTIMVGEALAAGARSIYVDYVDYVDYDAVAHHAGIMRPESLDALVGLDAVLGRLEQVAEAAPRDYRIVVLSDHGFELGTLPDDPSMTRQLTRPTSPALLTGVLLVGAAGAFALGPLVVPAYDIVTQSISETAAQGTPGAWVARTGFALLALAVLSLLPRVTWGWGSRAAYTLFALGLVAVGVWSHEPYLPGIAYDPAEATLHSVAATAMGLAVVSAEILAAWHTRRRARLGLAGAYLLLPVAMAVHPGLAGIYQRLMFATLVGALLVMSWQARRCPPRTTMQTMLQNTAEIARKSPRRWMPSMPTE